MAEDRRSLSIASPEMSVLPPDLDRDRLPHHVAVIMDGNGRWARRKGLPRAMGHHQGTQVLKDLVRCCKDWGIAALTAYAFSTENWNRPLEEVSFLLLLFEKVLRQELEELGRQGVRIQFVGNLAALPSSLQKEISHAMDYTQGNTLLLFTVATNYGGRQEIVQACRSIAAAVANGSLDLENIDENEVARHLYTKGMSDPDLLIRTSGEMRLSNFLLWQVAYSELYVTSTLWPDFDREAFYQALLSFQQRERRFGKI